MKRIVILGLLLLLPVLVHAAATRTLHADIPAAGINKLAIAVGVGELRVTPSTDDAVHVRVVLRQKSREFLWFFHWQSSSTAREIQAAQITRQKQGDRLMLSLSEPKNLDNDDVKQKWSVRVPARLAVDINMKVGQATVTGIAGGVHADLNVGEIDLDTPRGPMSADVNVGQIRATSGSAQHGNITLSSTIGEAALYINGKRVGAAGGHSGLGRSIHFGGSGPDSMKLSVNVGEVDLRITPHRNAHPH
ncbi:MAG: hypothetical protein ACYDB9_06950 [Gammaproteobacteria bacterium]